MLDAESGKIFGKSHPFHLGKQLGEIGGGEIHQGGSGIQGDALGVVFLKILLDLLDEQDLAPAGLGVLVKRRRFRSGLFQRDRVVRAAGLIDALDAFENSFKELVFGGGFEQVFHHHPAGKHFPGRFKVTVTAQCDDLCRAVPEDQLVQELKPAEAGHSDI